MRCSKNRRRLQEWFDQPVSQIPPDVASHIRECKECRTLVTRWNAIELEIQSMKNDGPELPAGFADSVRRRMREPQSRTRWELPTIAWKIATASAAAVVATAALLYVLGGMKVLFPSPRPSSTANIPQPGDRTSTHYGPISR